MSDDELVKHMTGLIAAGLDRIEQLTAELQVSNELGKALEEDAGQLRAERDRLQAQVRFLERKVVT